MFVEKLKGPEPAISCEFFPPKTDAGWETLARTMRDLRDEKLDFVSVTYGAGGSVRHLTADLVERMVGEYGLPAMAHLTCVENDADALRAQLDRYARIPVAAVMALRGDPPAGQGSFVPCPGGFAHASELISLVRSLHPSLRIGCAAYPAGHPESPALAADVRVLKLKQDLGADFAVTQLFFRNDEYFRFVELARAEGVTIPIVPGVMPVSSARQLRRSVGLGRIGVPDELAALMDREDDVSEEGYAFTLAQCRDLLERGVPGLHFYTLNHSDATRRLIRALRESGDLPA